MIRITCTHCRQVLTIDDGFAGGVCRCQHCGTIQTVPAAKPGAKTSALGAAAKTLYRAAEQASQGSRHGSGPDQMLSDSTLEELAEIVSSSGLRSNSRRLRQPLGSIGNPAPAAALVKPTKHTLQLILAGVVILALLLIIAWLVLRRPSAAQSPSAAPPAVVVAPPNFAGIQLDAEDTVVYLLDDGGSASDVLPAMESACYQSIKSLTPQRRFAVYFWRDASPRYPADGTVRATDDEEKNCEKSLADDFAQGSTQADAAFKAALACQPDAIVLVTAKAAQLPDDFADSLIALRADSHAKLYTVGINGDSSGDPSKPGLLATLAARTGGQFLSISSTDLARLGH